MQTHKNIILIGMPGVGKSTVGVLLAKRLKLAFVDTDIYIQTGEGKSLQELIQLHGTSGFCDLEGSYIQSLSATASVIATGGSVVYIQSAMEHLGAGGKIVHLDLELARLQKRLDDIDARGVVIGPNQKLGDLYAERQPLYAKYAEITIATDGLSPDQVVGRIEIRLNRDNLH
jgi:shikimate kinase